MHNSELAVELAIHECLTEHRACSIKNEYGCWVDWYW